MSSRFGIIAAALLVVIVAIFSFRRGAQDAPPKTETPNVPPAQSAAAPTATPNPTATPVVMSTTPVPVTDLAPADQARLKTLDQIFATRNDNDPRLDSEFRNMSPALKAALRDKYQATPNESRNQRGTEVFLLGREIRSSDDVAFISSVLNEPPCLSLQNCAQRPPGQVDEHASMANEITVVYPQLVAVRALGKYLKDASPDDPARKAAVDALLFAQRSPQSKIATAAQNELGKLHL